VHVDAARGVDRERRADLLGVGVDPDLHIRAVLKRERKMQVLIARLEPATALSREHVDLPVRPRLAEPTRRPLRTKSPRHERKRAVLALTGHEAHFVVEALPDIVEAPAERPSPVLVVDAGSRRVVASAAWCDRLRRERF